jgi:hypothetical protein
MKKSHAIVAVLLMHRLKSNGLLNYRFSVSPSGGGGWIPSMSYFLIEYNFGSANGATDAYTATEALKQSQKITLANDWVSSMFVGASFCINIDTRT